MQLFCISLLCAIGWTAASILHYTGGQASDADQAQVYSQQNSKWPFYSYGYSGKTSAKAEYTAADGYAKGFYSYIDANGELQTVRYVAGKGEGFKAAATNLPVDNGAADTPQPVTDTPEVKRAKLAHFEAYRATEMRDALANTADQQEQQQADEEHYNRNEFTQNDELLTLSLGAAGQTNDDDGSETRSERTHANELRYGQERSDFAVQQREEDDGIGGYYGHRQEEDASTTSVRVPIHAYYTLVAPTTRYSVLTPTVLRTIPLHGRDANKLPVSLSTTFVSQRLK